MIDWLIDWLPMIVEFASLQEIYHPRDWYLSVRDLSVKNRWQLYVLNYFARSYCRTQKAKSPHRTGVIGPVRSAETTRPRRGQRLSPTRSESRFAAISAHRCAAGTGAEAGRN